MRTILSVFIAIGFGIVAVRHVQLPSSDLHFTQSNTIYRSTQFLFDAFARLEKANMESTDCKKETRPEAKDPSKASGKASIIQKIDRECMIPQGLTPVDGNEPRRSRKPRKEDPDT
ncbi:uncharacterized protein LOC110981659 [Acanthaster planci]|uniref:Uncharacterized protein LOC110981659 n=1 Tax=Acanthaster planci TaxID=133434 RepID=A0A8B7YUU0_ACAPL|nr:uncharacterized protein LOC110981659 [Acanthaster planci]